MAGADGFINHSKEAVKKQSEYDSSQPLNDSYEHFSMNITKIKL
jgi:hypothetical protein